MYCPAARSHGRTLLLPAVRMPLRSLDVTPPDCQRRFASHKAFPKTVGLTKKKRYVSRIIPGSVKEVLHPLAEQLEETGIWTDRPTGRKGTKQETKQRRVKGDKGRINIVNEEVVSDILDYIGPTLKRHEGCDLVSVFPGAGLWAQALHDAVKPRSHLLLEPDDELYKPFLQPLMDQPGVRLVPASGIVWSELSKVLSPEYLPNQVEIDRTKPPPRNDTLLVTMNLSLWPKRRFALFESISRLVLFQLTQSMRVSGLFQKYGQVRMLIWIPDDEKHLALPRLINHRGRTAIEGELCAEYIAEVCGKDQSATMQGRRAADNSKEAKAARGENNASGLNMKRPGQFAMESVRRAMQRMKKAGLVMPPGYETFDMKRFKELGLPVGKPVPLTKMLDVVESFTQKEIQYLQGRNDLNKDEQLRLRRLVAYDYRLLHSSNLAMEFCEIYDEMVDLYKKASRLKTEKGRLAKHAKIKELAEQWAQDFEKLAAYIQYEIVTHRDNFHLFRQGLLQEPVLSWDRRPYEPMALEDTDFFPNVPCALLDIQPKAPNPLLRATGPGTNNAGDYFDLLVTGVFTQRNGSLPSRLDNLFPGLGEGILPQCPSLQDPAKGGLPMPLDGPAGLSPRILNQTQIMEILENLVKWPFRPTLEELLGRTGDTTMDEEMLNIKDATGSNIQDPFQ